MDASLVPSDIYTRMIAGLSETLLDRQCDIRVADGKRSDVLVFLQLLARPLSSDKAHKLLACWEGETYPAWQSAITQVVSRIWHRGWLNEDEPFIFDQGACKEKNVTLQSLLDLEDLDFDDCEECQRTVKNAVAYIYARYPRQEGSAARASGPESAANQEDVISDSVQPIITESRLFNSPDAEVCVRSKVCIGQQQTRYRLHKQLALASPVIRSLLEDPSADNAGDSDGPTVCLDETTATLDALFRVLYNMEFGEPSVAALPRLSNVSFGPLALGYLALKKLGFEAYAEQVRGLLRPKLTSVSNNELDLEALLSLLRSAILRNDEGLRSLVVKCLHEHITIERWLQMLTATAGCLDDLPCSELRDLVICLLKAHGQARIKEQDLYHNVQALSLYSRVLCNTPAITHDHQLYACYKLRCKPVWQAAQNKVVNVFLDRLYSVPEKPPVEVGESVEPSFIRLYENMMEILENLDIGTECRICKQAIEDWVESIKREYYLGEDTRKRNREQDEKSRKRKRGR